MLLPRLPTRSFPSASRPRPTVLSLVAFSLLTGACGGGMGGAPEAPSAPESLSEEAWRALARARPEAMEGAPRVSVGGIEVLAEDPWDVRSPLDLSLGFTELVAAGLLERTDVRYVERRRFAEAVARERAGRPRPPGAPPAGVSPGVDLILAGSWSVLGMGQAFLDLRLNDPESGDTRRAWRVRTPADPDPVTLARLVQGALLAQLDSLGTLPVPAPRPVEAAAAPVPLQAVEAFFGGLAAEERWRWEAARRGYQDAIRLAGGAFPEAEAALARTARLRLGGTLGES